jgi:hypothetical protein
MQGQRQQHITSRRRPRDSHTTQHAPSAAQQFKRLLVAPATVALFHVLMVCELASTVAPPKCLSKGTLSIRSLPPPTWVYLFFTRYSNA